MRRLALIAFLLVAACARDPEVARLQEENRRLKAQLEKSNRQIEENRETIAQLDRRIETMRTELARAEEMYRKYLERRALEEDK